MTPFILRFSECIEERRLETLNAHQTGAKSAPGAESVVGARDDVTRKTAVNHETTDDD